MSVHSAAPTCVPERMDPVYRLGPDGAFTISHFEAGPAFSSFLPGVAGLSGTPLWCFYVNRAQAIVSFGSSDKDNAIAEYLPANWAYQLVGIQGFRTFCLLAGDFYEPFSTLGSAECGEVRELSIHADGLELTSTNPARGLQVHVEYYSPPHLPLGALIRRVRFTNMGPVPLELTALDGLPIILPAGVSDHALKHQRHITAAYAYTRIIARHVPYFATKVAVHDEAEVSTVVRGNFYAAWRIAGARLQPLEPLIDPDVVFGPGQSLAFPHLFVRNGGATVAAQMWENRLACALVPLRTRLAPRASVELVALIGAAPDAGLATRFIQCFATTADFERARAESRRAIADVTAPAATVSAHPAFDAYARLNYLDNVLRGGVPVTLPSVAGPTLLHVFSRRHGDLERDYNYFVVPAHPLSSGVGNYRDICQNRRNDVWFYPEVRAHELRMFLELLQADGFNPLGVEGYRWIAAEKQVAELAPPELTAEQWSDFRLIITRPFQPGELLHWLDCHALEVGDRTAWLHQLIARCQRRLMATGHDGGYWIDHWTYLVDLLEALAAIYPDQLASFLHNGPHLAWFDEGARVNPRRTKYQRRSAGMRQLDAVTCGQPRTKPLPPVTPFGKLVALLAIKAISFDAQCRGLEMEAGRPGWNDAMNGLPGLFGSSSCEALALGRLANWLRDHLASVPDVVLPAPIATLTRDALAHLAASDYNWRAEVTTRETFRAALARDSDEATAMISGREITRLLELVAHRTSQAADRCTDPATGLTHTYFRNEPRTAPVDPASAIPDGSEPLPLFLEGQVHRLRLVRDRAVARHIYAAVRASALYDRDLSMYKLNAPLTSCSQDIGRARTFTPGWFENESVWLHMTYKYLLELLRVGLYDEFFHDAATMLVPFMEPHTYGRSILENSSFIASSANPDPVTRGRGFIARLSGSTAEFIHLWLLMTVGPRPFRLDSAGQLEFAPSPALPGDWFTRAETRLVWAGAEYALPADAFACALLGHTLLVYHNHTRRNTFGSDAVRPVRYQLDACPPIDAPVLATEHATRLRERRIARLEIWLE